MNQERVLCSNDQCGKRMDCERYLEFVRKANDAKSPQKFKPNKHGDCWVFLPRKNG